MAEERKESEGDSVGAAYQKAGPYLSASWQLSGSVALWSFLGWFLDGRLGTRPWLLVSGAVVGVGLGFYLFFKALLAIDKKK